MAEKGPLYTQPITAFRNKTLEQKVQELRIAKRFAS